MGGGEHGEWICIFRSGTSMTTMGFSRDPSSRRMCCRCLEEFDHSQIGCSCGGVTTEDGATDVYERYITVDETRSCLVLGIDIKPVMAEKYIDQYQKYITDNGGG